MPEDIEYKLKRILRDHEGYTGDGHGGEGALPIGDRTTARKPINKRDLREAFLPIAVSIDAIDATRAATENARDDALNSANDANLGATQSQLAALAAGAPMFLTIADGIAGVADGKIFMVYSDHGVEVYTRSGAGSVLKGRLIDRPYRSVAALLASNEKSRGAGSIWAAGGFLYEEALSSTPVVNGYPLVTAAGVKLRVRPSPGNIISTEQFGVVGDDTINDAAAFRAFWNFLRSEWFTHGRSYRSFIKGKIRVENPTEDRPGIAVYIMDFSGDLNCLRENFVRVTGSTAKCAFQIGTYETAGQRREVRGLHVIGEGASGVGGIILADLFQGRTLVQGIESDNCNRGVIAVNCQEVWGKDITIRKPQIGFDLTGGSEARASGSNGVYSTGVGPSYNNNNTWEVTVQGPAVTGILHSGGQNNAFSGVVQGAAPSGWNVDLVGGSGVTLRSLWLEASGSVHRELRQQAGFGALTMIGVKGATIGAIALFEGGPVTILSAREWDGYWTIAPQVTVIADGVPGNAANSGANNAVILSDYKPIRSHEDSVTKGAPQNRSVFKKGTITAGGSLRLFSGGNISSGDETKGFYARVHVWEEGTTNQCTAEIWVDGRATYPNVRSKTVEHLGSLLGCKSELTGVRGGSSPYHILYGDLKYTGPNTLKYEVKVEPFVL